MSTGHRDACRRGARLLAQRFLEYVGRQVQQGIQVQYSSRLRSRGQADQLLAQEVRTFLAWSNRALTPQPTAVSASSLPISLVPKTLTAVLFVTSPILTCPPPSASPTVSPRPINATSLTPRKPVTITSPVLDCSKSLIATRASKRATASDPVERASLILIFTLIGVERWMPCRRRRSWTSILDRGDLPCLYLSLCVHHREVYSQHEDAEVEEVYGYKSGKERVFEKHRTSYRSEGTCHRPTSAPRRPSLGSLGAARSPPAAS